MKQSRPKWHKLFYPRPLSHSFSSTMSKGLGHFITDNSTIIALLHFHHELRSHIFHVLSSISTWKRWIVICLSCSNGIYSWFIFNNNFFFIQIIIFFNISILLCGSVTTVKLQFKTIPWCRTSFPDLFLCSCLSEESRWRKCGYVTPFLHVTCWFDWEGLSGREHWGRCMKL